MTSRVALLACLLIPALAWSQKTSATLPAEAQARRITLPDRLPLSKALQAIQKQTSIEVSADEEADLKFPARLDGVPFWQAMDQVARAANQRLVFYRPDGKLGLMADSRGWRKTPVSYSGPFRVALKRVTMTHDLEENARYGRATLEVAWEPSLQAFLLDTHPADLVVEAGGAPLSLPEGGRGKAAAHQRMAMEVAFRLPAVPRSVARLDRLAGRLSFIGSPQMLTLTFDPIQQGDRKVVDGVTAVLSTVKFGSIWTIDVSLTYPPDMPSFESFQSWLVNNECYLVNRQGKKLGNAGFESDNPSANRAVIRYRFVEEDGLKLDRPADWKLIYRTPARIVELPVPFEFKDVALP